MGKQTRFHPVSLNVIRGAAEYAGFKLGKLRQTDCYEPAGTAQYTVRLLELPQDGQKQELLTIKWKLDSAFASDVGVLDVWVTRRGHMYAALETMTRAAYDRLQTAHAADDRVPADSDIPF